MQVFSEGPEALQQRLMALMGWAPLGSRARDAARLLYLRLDAKGNKASPGVSYFTAVLPPAQLPAAAPTP